MRKYILAIAAAALLAGCVSPAERAARNEAFNNELRQNAAAMQEGKVVAVIKCTGKEQCEKAFSLTKVYIQKHASMRIAQSDSNTVSWKRRNGTDGFRA